MSKEIWDNAYKSLSKFLKGKQQVCIPVQEDDDDQVIFRAIKRGEELEQQLKEAREVIEFYGDKENWMDMDFEHNQQIDGIDDPYLRTIRDGDIEELLAWHSGGKHARKFLSKWGSKNEST